MAAFGRLDPSHVGSRVVVRHRLPDGSATDVLGQLVCLEAHGLAVLADRGPRVGTVVDVAAAAVIAARPVPFPRDRPARLSSRSEEVAAILALERTAAAGWPAPVTDELGGWVLRAAAGWTRRANSTLVLGDPGVPQAEAVARVVAFAAVQGIRPRLSLPATAHGDVLDGALARHLAALGWAVEAPTLVMTGLLERGRVEVVRDERVRDNAVTGTRAQTVAPTPAGVEITSSPDPTAAWRAAYRHAAVGAGNDLPGLPDVGVAVMTGPRLRSFASVVVNGRPVALARGSVVDGWLGVTDVQVEPGWRRRGLARALLGHLTQWAGTQGADRVYLQVEESNAAALALYASAGLSVHHRSSYRVRKGPALS